jgi:hypothetical protein
VRTKDCPGRCGRRVPVHVKLCADCGRSARESGTGIAALAREQRLARRAAFENRPKDGPGV